MQLSRGGLAIFSLPPNAVSKAVAHRTVKEVCYILSGNGRMWRKLGEQEEIAELGPGVSLTIPTGTHFQYRCDRHEPLNAIGATMPPWPGENEAFSSTEPGNPQCKRKRVRAGQQLHKSSPDPNGRALRLPSAQSRVVRKTIAQTTPNCPRKVSSLIGRGVTFNRAPTKKACNRCSGKNSCHRRVKRCAAFNLKSRGMGLMGNQSRA